ASAAMAGPLFQDHRGFGQLQARPVVLLRNQRRHPARLGERVDESLRVGALAVDVLPVGRVELAAQRANGVAQLRMVVAAEIHFFGLRCADASSSMRSQISSAIGCCDSSSKWPTSPTARAITPSPRHTFQSNPSSQASAPIAPVALTGRPFALPTASISSQNFP